MRALALVLAGGLAACSGGAEDAPPLAGTPCPTLTAQAFQQRGVELKNNSAFNDLAVRRQFGTANCSGTVAGNNNGRGGSCELSSPGVTHVTVAGADHYFDIPVGEPATVQISGGDVRCVLTRAPRP